MHLFPPLSSETSHWKLEICCGGSVYKWKQSNITNQGSLSSLKKEKVESEVVQSCLALCEPMDSSLPGSSIHGIFQARVLEWTAISFSRGSSQPRDRTCVSCIADRCFTIWATRLLTSCQHMTTHAVLVHCCQHSGHWWSWATSVTIYLHDGNTPPPTWSCPPYMSLLQVPENIQPDF